MSMIQAFDPKPLWGHFDEILTIPRGSGNEEGMRQYVLAVAERHGYETKSDAVGNVVVKKPASSGKESAPVVILQSHLDMVEEKNSDVDHDFSKDPILPQVDGDYLKATGTTLGSDNGIGVAAMLAVADANDLVHGPLELLFTVDEETGLTGASGLGEGMLEGKILINLDSEEEGMLTIGCAGGADTRLETKLELEGVGGGKSAFDVKLVGLKGGHSGIDIHLQRGNAVKLLARALYAVGREHALEIAALEGGGKHNAIPREAFATIVVDEAEAAAVGTQVKNELAQIREEYGTPEPGLTYEVAEASLPDRVWTPSTTHRVLALLTALPHGVEMMSNDIPGLVETSTNLATATPENSHLEILLSSRSSVDSALEALRQKIRATAELGGAKVEEGEGYPGWQPDVESRILGIVQALHEKVLGTKPEVTAVHAGLECGIIGVKYPGMDMISFGPQIEFPHSPDERVKIASVADFYRLLEATLEELADG